MKDISEMLHKTTLTISCPLELFVWLKQTQRNCSQYVVEAIEAKRQQEKERDEQAKQVET